MATHNFYGGHEEECDPRGFPQRPEDGQRFHSARDYAAWKEAQLAKFQQDWVAWEGEMQQPNVTFYSLSSACDAWRMMEERVAESQPMRGDVW